MIDRRSRNKGARTEHAITKVLQASGFAAVKVSRGYRPGHDIVVPLMGRNLYLEVKARADGFRELYGWLDGRDVLIVKADRQEPLVIVRMSLAAEIANSGAAQ
jgi:Holliday junction resolvase